MKWRQLLNYLKEHNCRLFSEEAKHSIWICDDNNETTSVPRHSEVVDDLTIKICKDLGIPNINAK